MLLRLWFILTIIAGITIPGLSQQVGYYEEARLMLPSAVAEQDSSQLCEMGRLKVRRLQDYYYRLQNTCPTAESIEASKIFLKASQDEIARAELFLRSILPAFDSLTSNIVTTKINDFAAENDLVIMPSRVVLYRDDLAVDLTEGLKDMLQKTGTYQRVLKAYSTWFDGEIKRLSMESWVED